MRPTEPAALSDADTLAGPEGGVHHDLAPPARIGRYLVLHELGRGGMGVVLLAYDPELDRKVAVKLLGAQVADAAQQDRLLREAQAMARLAHPNVAAVFDVGVLGGQVYLAMEYVEGESLRAWLGARRPWRVVIDMFVQAGRGLAAAHAAGLVHRDFKPKSRSPLGRSPFSPSGRILKNRGVSRQGPWRVVPPCSAVLATGWQQRTTPASAPGRSTPNRFRATRPQAKSIVRPTPRRAATSADRCCCVAVARRTGWPATGLRTPRCLSRSTSRASRPGRRSIRGPHVLPAAGTPMGQRSDAQRAVVCDPATNC